MPQVDLETLVCCGGDGKVVCETLIEGGPRPDPGKDDPYFPPESFRLPIDEEIDWVDRNAAFSYDRDDSTKGTTNPKSQSQSNNNNNNNSNPPAKLHSNSQRFSGNLKPKAPIIGLPNAKLHQSSYLSCGSRRTGGQTTSRIFPKKPGRHGGKSAVPEWEPGSPKVSCFGKVRSERERDRHRVPRRSENFQEEEEEERSGGFWESFFGFSCCREEDAVEFSEEEEEEEGTKRSGRKNSAEKVKAATAGDAVMAAPGLGGMNRFASGRRAASWGGDVDAELEGQVESSGPLDPVHPELIGGRRSVGSLEDVTCDRESKFAGPASAGDRRAEVK